MFKKSLVTIIIASALAGCGGDDKAEIAKNNRGSIEIVGSEFVAGETLSVVVTDADQISADGITYAWSTGATGTSYTITEADEGSVITVSAGYTDEAGFTEGVGASTIVIKPTLDVTASIVKGPVAGASCDIYEISDSGAAAADSDASATSDDAGSVTFTSVNFEGPGLIACSGGSYTDESTGATLDAPDLRSVVEVVEGDTDNPAPSYVVSPLTEMAVQASGADLNDFGDVAEAINARFGIRFDTTETLPTAVGVVALGADDAEDADRYGSVLALLSQLDADDAEKDMATLIAEVAADLDDGSFSDASLDAFETAQTNLQTTSSVAADVDESLLDVIGSAVGYNNDPVTAIIEGVLSGTAQNTSTDPITGSVIVTDPNFEEDAIVPQSDVVLDFGTFSITADGDWSYTVDVANETVAALETGNSVNDSVTIASIDGTTAEIEIRVAALTQLVQISNTATSDTGEIRFAVDGLRQGKLTASILKEVALGSDGNVKDAYIALYGSSGSSAESLIDLRIQGNQTIGETAVAPRFFVRNTDSADYPDVLITAPFTEGQFYEIDITWDLDATDQITLTIDGEVIGGGAFPTAATVDPDFVNLAQWFENGVLAIQFRFGDNGNTVPFGSYFVDNIKVYSDTEGTTLVFEDDFESYTEGDALTGTDSPYSLSIYSEVTVFDVGDGTAEPTPAAFFDLTGATTSDATDPITGTVSVIDPDEGEAFLVPESKNTTYGSFSIEASGAWTYTLDTTNATIAALVQGERETDTISVESVDGTTAELLIAISGVGGSTTSANAAVIRDTLDSDTGELRYDIDPTLSGRLEVSFTRTATGPGAFIALLNDSGSTSSGRSIVDMRIDDDAFSFRDHEIAIPAGTVPTPGTLQNVVITWTAATETERPTVNVTIDGVALPSFVSGGSNFTDTDENSGGVGGVERVQFRFGSNSATTDATDTFTINSFEVFSDVDGNTSIFADDFSTYIVGDSLDDDNAASPYSGSTSEAVVEAIDVPAESPQVAVIRDTLDSDTGELRYDIDPTLAGRLEVSFTRTATGPGAFIALLNDSGSTSSGRSIVDMRIDDDAFSFRDHEIAIPAGTIPTPGTLQNVVITWTAATETERPTVNVTIDGVAIPSFVSGGSNFTDTDENSGGVGGVERVQFRFGSNSATTDATDTFTINSFEVFSDVDGNTSIFADDFSTYIVGDSLDDDNSASPYSGSTSEATVEVFE